MGDLNDDNDTLCIWDHMYKFAGQTIQIHEDYDAGLGGTLFDGALLACNYLEYMHGCDPDAMRGKRVIELGSGCALPGLLAGALGASEVYVTDIEETVELMEENIENNQATLDKAGCEAKALELDWTNKEQIDAAAALGPFDWILAADTVYNIEISDAFVETVKALSGPNTKLLFAHPCPRLREASAHFWGKVLDPNNSESPFEAYKLDHLKFAPQANTASFQVPTHGLFIFTLLNKSDDDVAGVDTENSTNSISKAKFEIHGLSTCITADAAIAAAAAASSVAVDDTTAAVDNVANTDVAETEVEEQAIGMEAERERDAATVESVAIGDIAL